jgi:hypothetical protein
VEIVTTELEDVSSPMASSHEHVQPVEAFDATSAANLSTVSSSDVSFNDGDLNRPFLRVQVPLRYQTSGTSDDDDDQFDDGASDSRFNGGSRAASARTSGSQSARVRTRSVLASYPSLPSPGFFGMMSPSVQHSGTDAGAVPLARSMSHTVNRRRAVPHSESHRSRTLSGE